MVEYIDRDKIIRAIMRWEDKPYFSYDAVLRDVMNLPSANVVERKRGKWDEAWLDQQYAGCRPRAIYCSNCHIVSAFKTPFCPNCGADMRGGEDG